MVNAEHLTSASAAPGTDTEPERSAEWTAYRAKWFTPVHPCEGAECAERQPPDTGVGEDRLDNHGTAAVDCQAPRHCRRTG